MNRNFLRLYALTRLRTSKEQICKLREELEDEEYLELKQYILNSTGGVIELPTKLEEILHLYFAKAAIEKEKKEVEYSPDWEAMYTKLKELFIYESTQPLDPASLVEIKDILKTEKDAILSKITMIGKASINDESIFMAKKELFSKVELLKYPAIEEALKELSIEKYWVTQEVKGFFSKDGQAGNYGQLSDEEKLILERLKKEIKVNIKNILNEKETENLTAQLIKQINIVIKGFVESEIYRKAPLNRIEMDSVKALLIILLMQKAWVFIDKYFEINNWGLPSLKFMEILMNLISGNKYTEIKPSSPYIYSTIDIHGLIKDYESLYLKKKLRDLGLENIDQEMEKDHFFDDIVSLQELLKKHPATTIRLDTTDYRPKKPGKKKDESQFNLKISSLADEAIEVNTVLHGEKKLAKEFLTYMVHIDKYIDDSVVTYDINRHEKRKTYIQELHSIMEETGLDDVEEYTEIFKDIKQQMRIYKKKSRET